MKIFHICLSCFYIDDFSYQENELVKQHVKDGHDVTVVASTEVFNQDRKLSYCEPSTYMGSDNAKVIRLPYRSTLPHSVMKKLRMHPGLFRLLSEEKPEAILFHGICGWELLTVAKYCRANPDVIFYVDSHEDYHNSAKGIISRYILHKLYYRFVVVRSITAIRKVLCVTPDTERFVKEMYGVSSDLIEFFPLGGILFDDDEYDERRSRIRARLGVDENTIVISQTGKMGIKKKLIESLTAFNRVSTNKFLLVVAGTVEEEIQAQVDSLVSGNEKIRTLGWLDSEDMRDLLCGSDLYLQPGTQSASMQMSLCARCPVVLDDINNHKPFVRGNGWTVRSQSDIEKVLLQISDSPELLKLMSQKSLEIARELLDYRALAERVLRQN